MEAAIFYVYEHWRPDTNRCFYVGKGSGRRAGVMYGRSTRHTRIQRKLEGRNLAVEVRVVAQNLTEEEAFAAERDRIARWAAQGVALVNLTDGGEGSAGAAKESRAKMRAAKLGRRLSEEHKSKIAAGTKVALSRPETRAKLSASIRAALATPEAKANRSRGQKSRVRTKEHYERVAASLRGRKLSPEHIEATRRANLGRKQSAEEIEKRRAANSGRKRSADFCQRMAAAWTPERKAAQAERTRQMNLRRHAGEKPTESL